MKNKKMIISIFLCMVLLINIISFQSVYATQDLQENVERNYFKTESSVCIDQKDIPEAININDVKEKNYVCRFYEKEEDMETIVFGSSDGSETTYLFNEPVKYTDKDGVIKDKSNKLYNISQVKDMNIISSKIINQKLIEKYSYVNLDNDIKTLFPQNLSKDNSIIIGSENINIAMYPIFPTDSSVYMNEDKIYYDEAFGKFTSLRYQTLFNGLKEDIILEKYTESKFKFVIDIGDYVPVLENNYIYIKSEDGLTVATINPIYVYSSSIDEAQFSYDNSFIVEKENNGKYEITVCVDEEFLKNPKTVYPVYIDPTITINSTGSGSGKTIIDTPIYNGSSVSNQSSGSNSLALIGKVDSTYGVGRLLIKFPGLMKKNFMNSNYTITNAKLIFLEVSGHTTKSGIAAYQYTGPNWDETSTYSSSIWNGVGNHIDWRWFYYPDHTSEFLNILSAVKNWQTNHSLGNKGLILKNISSESDFSKTKTMYTSEGVTKPYVSVTYFYNGVKGVRNVSSTGYRNINCQSFAFWLSPSPGTNVFPQFTTEGTSSDYNYCLNTTTANALVRTKTRMTTWLNANFYGKWREVSAYNVSLNSNEWLIAMRVGVGDCNQDGIKDYDYHFWYRAKNGKWYNKHGYYAASEEVSGNVIDPSISNHSNGWKLGYVTPFYNSATVYYAIKQ